MRKLLVPIFYITSSYLTSMSRKYKFLNPAGLYFISFATVDWINVFTRKEYKDILIEQEQ